MASLKAIFKLTDGYTKTIQKIISSTDSATSKIEKVSKSTDKFNEKLKDVDKTSKSASSGIEGFVKGLISIAAVKKIIDLADEMTQITARLNLVNDGLQDTAQLQDKIMASANRSRAAYMDTAATVSKLGTLAGSAFKSNDELIAFVELMNKNFAIGGSSIQEQTAAMYQLTQAMASGRLQGDEFRSIMENAPLLAQAIAKYMGKTTGELREMSAEGQITADIIKGAMFSTADEVNKKFAQLPMTFGQAWTIIQNSLLETFLPLIQTIAKGAQWIADNWDNIEPVFYGAAAAVGFFTVAIWIAEGAAKAFFATLLSNPLFYIALAIGVVIGAIYKWAQSVGGFQIAWQIVVDKVLTAWDWVKIGFFTGVYWVMDLWDKMLLSIMKAGVGIQNFMGDMKAGVLSILQNMVNGAIGIINDFINLLNKIPGVSIDAIQEVTFGTTAQLENEAAKQARNSALEAYSSRIDAIKAERDAKLETMKADALAATAERQLKISEAQAEAKANAGKAAESYLPEFTPVDPGTIKGTGKNGKLEVDMSDEDLKYLRDIAERDYINKFTTATLAPNITVQFGDVHETADADKVAGRIRKILQEEIAMAAEGSYA